MISIVHLTSASSRVPGLVALGVAALSLLAGGCEKTSTDVVDSPKAVSYQTHAAITPDSVNTDDIIVGPEKLPDDVLPITIQAEAYFDPTLLPQEVSVKVHSGDGTSLLATHDMAGSGPLDPIWGQKYVATVTFTIRRTVIGKLQVESVGTTEDGLSSNTVRLPLEIIRLNQPPALSNLQAPDSVTLQSSNQYLLLQVDVQDPNGQSDIRSVYFNTTKPNGAPSSGNPFAMYDDGTNGDDTAGDGTYSLIVVLPPSTTLGTYTFEFQAVDRSDSVSVPLVHQITVTE